MYSKWSGRTGPQQKSKRKIYCNASSLKYKSMLSNHLVLFYHGATPSPNCILCSFDTGSQCRVAGDQSQLLCLRGGEGGTDPAGTPHNLEHLGQHHCEEKGLWANCQLCIKVLWQQAWNHNRERRTLTTIILDFTTALHLCISTYVYTLLLLCTSG